MSHLNRCFKHVKCKLCLHFLFTFLSEPSWSLLLPALTGFFFPPCSKQTFQNKQYIWQEMLSYKMYLIITITIIFIISKNILVRQRVFRENTNFRQIPSLHKAVWIFKELLQIFFAQGAYLNGIKYRVYWKSNNFGFLRHNIHWHGIHP